MDQETIPNAAEVKVTDENVVLDGKVKKNSLFFLDGKTRIDFVLVYNASETDPVKLRKREIFELNLLSEKLLLERAEEVKDAKLIEEPQPLPPESPDNPDEKHSTIVPEAGTDTTANVDSNAESDPQDESQTVEIRVIREAEPVEIDDEQVEKIEEVQAEETAAEVAETLGYLKVHAPFEVLAKYAEALKMPLPVKESIARFVQSDRVLKTSDCRALLEENSTAPKTESPTSIVDAETGEKPTPKIGLFESLLRKLNMKPSLEPIQRRYALPFTMHRSYLFNIQDHDKFFDPKDRSYIVDYILQRKSYTRLPTGIDSALTSIEPSAPDDSNFTARSQTCTDTSADAADSSAAAPEQSVANEMGISRLLNDGVYLAAFPLHDCPLTDENRSTADDEYANSMRYQLWREWADFRNAVKPQPINHIQRYFGDAIAWYFAWLGFYTKWLLPLSLVGLLIFIYGLSTAYDSKVEAFCAAQTTMCPLCLKGCPYWQMRTQCINMLIGRIFENPMTVVWGIVVTLWCTLFLETWKRRQSFLQFEWNLFGVEKDEEPPRPEYAALAESQRRGMWKTRRFQTRPNPITGRKEVHVPYWTERIPSYAVSVTAVLFGMLLVLAAVAGVVVYRIVMQTLIFQSGSAFFSNLGPLVASATGAVINLLCIMLLGLVYELIAGWLTDREYWRTQSEYDGALMAKLVALQCVNYYSPIAYTAFLKGRFASVADYAALSTANRTETSNIDFTIDMCPSGSCLPDLCMQLIIIMCYKQLIQNNVMEIFLPKAKAKLRSYMKNRRLRKSSRLSAAAIEEERQVESNCKSPFIHYNYKLQAIGPRPLFGEYLEMIIQYGFVSIFAIAFPLAPVFALLNNIIEIRLDARKFLVELRRPVAVFDVDIGIWYKVLFLLSRVAIITNGALIAFTSDLIPNFVYSRTEEYSNGSNTHSKFDYDKYTQFAYSTLDTEVFERDGVSAVRAIKLANGSTVEINPGTCMFKGFFNPPDAVPPALPYAHSKVYWHVMAWRIAAFVVFENAILMLTELLAYLIPDTPRVIEQRQRKERHLMRRLVLKADTLAALKEEKLNAKLAPVTTAMAVLKSVKKVSLQEFSKKHAKAKLKLLQQAPTKQSTSANV